MLSWVLILAVLFSGLTATAAAQTKDPPDSALTTGAPAPLTIYFGVGSSSIRGEDKAVLDKASRAYNEGKPIVMIITGSADRTGSAEVNLDLSQRRAFTVLKALLDRGIPAERFQIFAKGVTDLPVPTDPGVAESRNRRVDITWR